MHIAFNTEDLSQLDLQVLAVLSAGSEPGPTIGQAQAAARAEGSKLDVTVEKPAKPVAKKTAPEPEPVPNDLADDGPQGALEEDLLGGEDTPAEPEGPTMADAVAAATKLVSSGGAAKVKEALAVVGAKRVSEVPADGIQAFLDALK